MNDLIFSKACRLLILSLPSHSFQWRHNERDDVSNHRRLNILLNRLFRRLSKKTSKLRVTGLCEWNPPGAGWFPSQRTSNAANVSIWWRYRAATQLKIGYPTINIYGYTIFSWIVQWLDFKIRHQDNGLSNGCQADVIQRQHFLCYWTFVRGIQWPPVFPSQRPVTRSLMLSLICAWINGWVINCEAGDLRRHRAHFDVMVMDEEYLLFWM